MAKKKKATNTEQDQTQETTSSLDPLAELRGIVKGLQKKHGDEALCLIGDKVPTPIDVISTGSWGIDRATGIGGLPRGRIVEIFGQPSSGKTTLAASTMAQAQKMGLNVALIDVEHAFDFHYAKKSLGLDPDKMIFSQPDSAELALQLAIDLAATKKFGIIVLDSIAALIPQSEIDGDLSEHRIAERARLISRAIGILNSSVASSNTLMLMINQIRVNIGGFSPNGVPETTPGGNAPKFYASMRARISGKFIPSYENPTGLKITAKFTKNKCAVPNKVGYGDFRFANGFWQSKDILEAALQVGVLVKKGAWIGKADNTLSLGCGLDASAEMLEADPALMQRIKTLVDEYEPSDEETADDASE